MRWWLLSVASCVSFSLFAVQPDELEALVRLNMQREASAHKPLRIGNHKYRVNPVKNVLEVFDTTTYTLQSEIPIAPDVLPPLRVGQLICIVSMQDRSLKLIHAASQTTLLALSLQNVPVGLSRDGSTVRVHHLDRSDTLVETPVAIGRRLYVAYPGGIRVYHPHQREVTQIPRPHQANLALLTEGHFLYVVDAEHRRVEMVDPNDNATIATFTMRGPVTIIGPQRLHVAAKPPRAEVEIDLLTLQERALARTKKLLFSMHDFSDTPHHRWILKASRMQLVVLNRHTQQVIHQFDLPTPAGGYLMFDERLFLTHPEDGTLSVYDVASQRKIHTLHLERGVTKVEAIGNIVCVHHPYSITVIDVEKFRVLATLSHPSEQQSKLSVLYEQFGENRFPVSVPPVDGARHKAMRHMGFTPHTTGKNSRLAFMLHELKRDDSLLAAVFEELQQISLARTPLPQKANYLALHLRQRIEALHAGTVSGALVPHLFLQTDVLWQQITSNRSPLASPRISQETLPLYLLIPYLHMAQHGDMERSGIVPVIHHLVHQYEERRRLIFLLQYVCEIIKWDLLVQEYIAIHGAPPASSELLFGQLERSARVFGVWEQTTPMSSSERMENILHVHNDTRSFARLKPVFFESIRRSCSAVAISLLAEHPTFAQTRTPRGYTALMLAAQYNLVDVIQALLTQKADVRARDDVGGYTALMIAAANGHLEAVRDLVKHDSDVAHLRMRSLPRCNQDDGVVYEAGIADEEEVVGWDAWDLAQGPRRAQIQQLLMGQSPP